MAEFDIDTVEMKIETCCNCGIPFAMTAGYKQERLKDGKSFHCPNGHSQYYTEARNKDNEIQKLKDQRDRYKNRMYHYIEEADHKEHQRRGQKAAFTRLKNSVSRGECPCCGKHFDDLENHMNHEHPEYKTEETDQ